jgi:ABC-type molybdate transport system substrate-binding protein
VTAKAKDADTAKAFVTFMRSAAVKAMLAEKGFDVP